MGAKVKCRDCGAKNDANSRRCRVCAALINLNVPEPGKGGDDTPAPAEQGHFDPSQIGQQMRPAAGMFKSSGGGLAGRLAAAKGGEGPSGLAPSPDSWATPPAPPADDPWASGDSFGGTFGPSSAPTFEPQSFGPQPEPASFGPQSFGPQPEPPSFDTESFEPQSFEPQSFGPSVRPPASEPPVLSDETFNPQEFTVAKPDLPPPLEVEEERFDPNALFRDEPGAF
jgi:hypothetical protein